MGRFSNKFQALSKRKKRALKIFYALLVGAVYLVSAEIVLRLKGRRPWDNTPHNIRVEPGGRFFKKDSLLGFAHLPGSFQITLADGYAFRVTHGPDSLRATHPPNLKSPSPPKPQIWIFGCSLTHGWSLNDDETYPWRLQEALSDYEVVNFGVNGYGTLQSYLQFEQALSQRNPPQLVVLAYMKGHDARNSLRRSWRKQLVPQSAWGQWDQPMAYLDGQGELRHVMSSTTSFKEFPFMRVSALAHYFEMNYNRVEELFTPSREISKILIRKFNDLALSKGIRFGVAGIWDEPETHGMVKYCRKQGIPAGDISVNLKLKENNNFPHDPHPSAQANRQFAAGLKAFLSGSGLLSPPSDKVEFLRNRP